MPGGYYLDDELFEELEERIRPPRPGRFLAQAERLIAATASPFEAEPTSPGPLLPFLPSWHSQ